MMFSRIQKCGLILMLLALCLGGVMAQDKQTAKKKPTLAELARESRAKKSVAPTRARTITNADLPGLEAKLSQGSFPEQAEPGEAGETVAETAEPDDGVVEDDPFAVNDAYDESLSPEVAGADLTPEQMAVWNDAFREARSLYQNAVNEALVLQLRVNNLENSYFSQSDGALQERLEADLNQTLKAISTNQRTQQDAKSALEALKMNASAAGIPPEKIEELVGKLPGTPPEIEIRLPEPDPDEPPQP